MRSRFAIIALLSIVLPQAAFRLGTLAKPRAQTQPQARTAVTQAQESSATGPKSRTSPDTEHAYHNEPPKNPVAATLDPAQFLDNTAAFVAYSIAAKIPKLLYQQPCYCGCDKAKGHQSLLDCYTSTHAVHCNACQAELVFIFEHSKTGKTASEIREDMEEAWVKGDLWKVDVKRYAEAHQAQCKRLAP